MKRMKLYLDTTDSQKTIVTLDEFQLEKVADFRKSQQVLILIDQILKEKKKTLKEINEIQVNLGPGSFTGIRVGLSVANTLAWLLKIPVNGQTKDEEKS